MTEAMAIEIARSKMRELGKEGNYTLRFRYIFLDVSEKLTLKMGDNLLILINADYYNSVSSKAGIYNVKSPESKELQFVHTGNVNLENLNEVGMTGFNFLQVIPLNQNP